MEPATSSAWAAVVSAFKESPLWLLVAIALSLTVLCVTPQFRQLVTPTAGGWVLFATIVAWILVLCRAASPALQVWNSHKEQSKARVKFVITPVEHQCFWGIAKQPDGSFVTQISGHFMVKNRTTEPLYLMKATLARPKIVGEVLPGLLTMQSTNSRMHGTAHVSGNFLPPSATLPIASTILIRGVPEQQAGVMDAIIEIIDANANKERVKVTLKCIAPVAPSAPLASSST